MTTTSTKKTDNEQLVADLAWEYREKRQKGHAVQMKDYLKRCPDRRSQLAFKGLVNTDLLLDLATRESKESVTA